jgi:hypothetical protein
MFRGVLVNIALVSKHSSGGIGFRGWARRAAVSHNELEGGSEPLSVLKGVLGWVVEIVYVAGDEGTHEVVIESFAGDVAVAIGIDGGGVA